MIVAFFCILNEVLNYFYIECEVINYISGTSILSLLFFYLASYAFEFCEYHRMFLHYILTCNLINIIDCYVNLPISNFDYLLIQLIVAGIFLYVIFYLRNKCKYTTYDKQITCKLNTSYC
jgi:hypothetical protein